jgi:hypothetical protein
MNDPDPEPVYTIYQAFASLPVAETIGAAGLMETFPRLAPDLYEIRERGRVVATGGRWACGDWKVEFLTGVVLSPGCMIV